MGAVQIHWSIEVGKQLGSTWYPGLDTRALGDVVGI
jgi:hypothetical protein